MSSPTWRADLLNHFLALPQGDKIQAECILFFRIFLCRACFDIVKDVWIDGDGGLRSKTTVCANLAHKTCL
jgi:glutamine synthetase